MFQDFSDDTNLLFAAKAIVQFGTIESVINHESKPFVQWLRSNKLSLNKTKTDPTIFRSSWKHLPGGPDIRISNYKLKLNSHIKYLGIFIDKVLSWNKEIDYICTRPPRANGILS